MSEDEMKKLWFVLCVVVIVGLGCIVVCHDITTLRQLRDDKAALSSSLSDLQAKYDELRTNYNILKDKHYDVELNNPTYEQVKISLQQMKGIKVEGNCLDKTKYVQDHFYNEGIQCYIVIANLKRGEGHAIVAFNTEQGWVYAEPDGMAEVKIAKDLPYYIPNRAYEGPVGMTAQGFSESMTVIQLIKMR
jgi:hypothetical protein